MQNSLFEEEVPSVMVESPAEKQAQLFDEQRVARRREVDRLRQQRHRARKKESSVTVGNESVTLAKVSRSAPELSRFQETEAAKSVRNTPELRLLLDTFCELAELGASPSREDIENALTLKAKAEGVQIFHAARFLESAFERGVLPRFSATEWVSVPRELLGLLMSDK